MLPLPLVDLHIHSKFSFDSELSMENACREAVKLGFREITFTEHLTLAPGDPNFRCLSPVRYLDYTSRMKEAYSSRLQIRCGLEVDYVPSALEEIKGVISGFDWDYVLGSIHYVDGQSVLSREIYQRPDPYEAVREYYSLISEAAESGLFDAIAHLDYINRGTFLHLGEIYYPQNLVDKVLSGLIKNKLALELNTAGWRRETGLPSPDPGIINRYLELGGKKMTIGSDAHALEEFGFKIKDGLSLLRSLGIKEVAVYSHRRAFPLSI